MFDLKMTPMGFEQLSAVQLGSAIGLQSIPAGANVAILTPVGADVMYRDDANAGSVSATVGTILKDSVQFQYTGALSQLRFILKSATPVLNVQYYKLAG